MESGESFAEHIVNGTLPNKRVFTREEALLLVQTALIWSAEQIRHTVEEYDLSKEIKEAGTHGILVNSFKTKVDALLDIYEYWTTAMLETAEFIETWFIEPTK